MLGQMGSVEIPGPSLLWGSGCMGSLWARIPECLSWGALKGATEEHKHRANCKAATAGGGCMTTVGAKTEPSQFLTVPAVQFMKEF